MTSVGVSTLVHTYVLVCVHIHRWHIHILKLKLKIKLLGMVLYFKLNSELVFLFSYFGKQKQKTLDGSSLLEVDSRMPAFTL